MEYTGLADVFAREGYRFCQGTPKEVGIYYKYYKEGFHVVLSVELSGGYRITPEQQRIMEERVLSSFYHPQGVLSDFPEGFPVYHVEVLTLLVGGGETGRQLCTQCRNIWQYEPETGRLRIFENQPGDFFGLRQTLENEIDKKHENNGKNSIKTPLKDAIRSMKSAGGLPYVTLALVMMNVFVYLVMELAGDTTDGLFVAKYGGMYPMALTDKHEWWRLFTAGFIHFGAAHLINNMVILYCMGSRLERVVGHMRFAVIYLISLLGGSLLSFAMMLYTQDYAVSAGASGAIFGVVGGFLWVVILHRGRLERITARGLLFMIALTVYYGFSSAGIDNWGHIGGVLTGFVTTVILYHRKYQKY